MKIACEWKDGKYPTFTLHLSSKEGADPFLSVNDCRIVQGKNGEFVSWPAKKLDSGKYWNYCRSSDAFTSAVLEVARASQPKGTATRGDDDDSRIPF